MIKQDIVDNVANATGLTKVEVEAVLNESFSEIIKALSNNEKIELRGFGTFSAKHRLPKKARNPKTGDPIFLPERYVPVFKPSKLMKKTVNEKLIEYGLEPIIPKKESREILHTVIYDELCFNVRTEESRDKFVDISNEVNNNGADSIILGCTEVGMLLNNENVNLPVYDTVQVHCNEIFTAIL